MIGITLTSEQIRTAPPEVRRWIERQVATFLGLQTQISNERARIEHLAICSLEELGVMLTLIQEAFPAVNVLFELGRPGASFAQGRVEAYRLSDILHHTRLQNVNQVVACLELINEALRRVRGAADAAFYSLDSDGHCFIAAQTQQNILRLWQEIISERVAGGPTGTAIFPQSAFQAEASQPLENSTFETRTTQDHPRASDLSVS